MAHDLSFLNLYYKTSIMTNLVYSMVNPVHLTGMLSESGNNGPVCLGELVAQHKILH